MRHNLFKYLLSTRQGSAIINMPADAVVVSVGAQNGLAVIWARVPQIPGPTKKRRFDVVFTGDSVEGAASFIGTIQFDDGIVSHVFEVL